MKILLILQGKDWYTAAYGAILAPVVTSSETSLHDGVFVSIRRRTPGEGYADFSGRLWEQLLRVPGRKGRVAVSTRSALRALQEPDVWEGDALRLFVPQSYCWPSCESSNEIE